MSLSETQILAKGKYSQSWMIILIIGGMGALMVAAGIYSFMQEEAKDIAHLPLLFGGVFVLIALLFFLLQGKVILTSSSITAGRRMGGKTVHPLDEIGEVRLNELSLYSKEGKRLKTFGKVSPDRMPGAVWMFHHYYNKMPAKLLSTIGEKRPSKNYPDWFKPANRRFEKSGSPALEDHGMLLRHESKYFYVPEFRTESPGSILKLISPIVITRYVDTPGIPSRDQLPIYQTVNGIMSSSLSEDEKFQHITLLIQTHWGNIISENSRDSENNLVEHLDDGTEVKVMEG